MSQSFPGGNSKTRDRAGEDTKEKEMLGGRKYQFYVEFLGWMESNGVRGQQYTDPAVQELKRRQQTQHRSRPPKLTIQLTQKEMKITQDLEEKPNPRAIKKIKFPAIPARDITFAVQSRRSSSDKALEDVVACIYLGYMPRTQRYVHVHVYRFDAPSTASTFVHHINDLIGANHDRIVRAERELAEKGEIEDPRLASSDGMSSEGTRHTCTDSAAGSAGSGSGYSEEMEEEDGYPATLGAEDVDEADLQSLCEVQAFDNVTEELKHRLTLKDGPLLLPPKDYDTISRARGNMLDINQRRCLSLQLVGGGGGGGTTTQDGGGGGGGPREELTSQQRHRYVSDESGVDLASPNSEGADFVNRFSESDSSVLVQSRPRGLVDNGYVYPPRQERGGASSSHPGVPSHPGQGPLRRHSSQSSTLSTHSSRDSHHSDPQPAVSNSRRLSVPCGRANSTNSFHTLPAPPHPFPLSQAAVSPINDDFLPPKDYDDYDEDLSLQESTFRSKPFPVSSTRRASGSDIPSVGGGSLLTRSLPASVLYAEIRRGGGMRGGVEEVEEEVYHAERRSRPVYPSPRPW
ncbi:hypothetical protein ACOMHN_035644 [Nucella lapillus]